MRRGVVTIYAADGLHDGKPNWAQTQFDEFTKKTGIKVQYVEAGSGGVVERVNKESTNPQADVLVTLPPFIMKAAADGLLQPYTPAGADHIDAAQKDKGGLYVALCNNYMNFIYNTSAQARRRRPSTICSTRNSRASCSTRRPVRPATAPQ